MQIHLGMDIRQTNCPSRHKGHFGVLGGQTFKSLEKLSNGWTDWHQLWFTSADSSGNGHRLNTSRPTIPRDVLGGHKFKCLGKLSNCSTDCHQVWYMSADSSGNGHSKIQFAQQYHRGHLGGGVYGVTHLSLGKLPNGWTDWHQIRYTSVDSSVDSSGN